MSFGGFCFENIFVAITEGYIDNRNMVLPFLLGYGIAMAAVYLICGTPSAPRFLGISFRQRNKLLNTLYYFTVVFLVVSVGELCIGTFVERVCDVTWWDYSEIPLNFTKFTSVPTSIGFTALMMIFIQFLYAPLYGRFKKINKKILYPTAVIFTVLLIADCVFSGVRMYLTNDFMIIWRISW